jgi:hypothetical protein
VRALFRRLFHRGTPARARPGSADPGDGAKPVGEEPPAPAGAPGRLAGEEPPAPPGGLEGPPPAPVAGLGEPPARADAADDAELDTLRGELVRELDRRAAAGDYRTSRPASS